MLVSGRSAEYFGNHFPEVPRFLVKVPSLIASSPQGTDFRGSARLLENRRDDFCSTNYSAMDGVLSALNGPPDLVITDYEPVAAQLAYATCCPLITVDNQSSFLGFCFPAIQSLRNGKQRTRQEERSRLSLFFPKAEERFAVSFLEITYPSDPCFPVTIIPPIIRPNVRQPATPTVKRARRKIVVYLSPGKPTGSTSAGIQTSMELTALFRSRCDCDFVIFTDSCTLSVSSNVSVRPFDGDGLPCELRTCDGVIATAGHTLLSEIVHFKKPVLAIPVDTFEQTYNARSVEATGIGLVTTVVTPELLNRFVTGLPSFREAYEKQCARGSIVTGNGIEVLTESLRVRYGL